MNNANDTMGIDNESRVRKILFNEVSFAVAGIGLITSVMFWVMNPQQDLEIQIVKLQAQVESNEQVGVMLQKFKDNDLHEMQLRMDRIEARQVDELQAIARIEALLKQ